MAPAAMPAKKETRLAMSGFTPATISAAPAEAPNVNDPSTVISGKSKIRKLMKIPSASNARINPMMIDPMSNDMVKNYLD
jgi:hypothetical protein